MICLNILIYQNATILATYLHAYLFNQITNTLIRSLVMLRMKLVLLGSHNLYFRIVFLN